MKCPRCQHDSPEGARFCEECATPLARTCSNCGTALSAAAKFCHACAHPVPAGVGTLSRAPESYTPKHLAEKILTSKAALEGERKQVTVLFADLKGSMELLADRDPEEARKILDPVLTLMMDAVHRYEGTVNQVMGDGIMALFGAPLAHEDHAVRACYAALRMQDNVKRYAADVRRSHGIEVQIRVGLNSGEVVVRAIGSDLHTDYTAVGETTHLAARMEQLADPGCIFVTTATARLAEGFVQVTSQGLMGVKGVPAPIEVYELIRVSTARSRLQAAAARGLTRFVGRTAEMEAVNLALERAGRGQGQVVATVGEPGVGKSRLIWELTHSPRTEGWLVLESSGMPYGAATTYLPLIQLLKTFFELDDRDDARQLREKVIGKLATRDEVLLPELPVFLALLDLHVEEPAWQGLDPSQRRRRTLEACKRLLLRESQLHPVLLVFEDLHWIDTETQAFLDSVVDSVPTARIMMLVNYRPEYQHPWGGRSYYTQLRIDALPAVNAGELLQALLGDEAQNGLTEWLITRTQGNPFFLEESVQSLVETGILIGGRGAYRLAKPLAGMRLPATVQAVLASRIDRLPPGEKALLQAAAVIGKDVPVVLLQGIAELPEAELGGLLTHLQAAEFLYETRLFPDVEYTFKHALTHEVAYETLLQERRRVLHGRVVNVIEDRYVDRLGEHVESLAHHAVRGERWERAVDYLRQAGAKAMPRSAHRTARACLEQALLAVERLPKTRDRLEQAIDLRFDLAMSLAPMGELAAGLQRLRESESLAESLGDRRRLGRARALLTESFWAIGDHTQAIAVAKSGLALAEEMGDHDTKSVATFVLGRTYYTTGDYPEALHWLKRTVASCEEDRRQEYTFPIMVSVISRTYLVRCLVEVGDFTAGMAVAEEALQIADRIGHPLDLVSAHLAVGLPRLHKGELDAAIIALERSLQILKGSNISGWFYLVASPLGLAYALAGNADRALPLLEATVEDTTSRGRIGGHSQHLDRLGEGYLLASRIEEAGTVSERALDFSRKYKERANEAWALRLLGEIAVHRGPHFVKEAQTHYDQALTLANELGMRPLVAHCHLGLGKLYLRTDKREQPQEHLAAATTMYREMGMTYWLEKAEAEMRELR